MAQLGNVVDGAQRILPNRCAGTCATAPTAACNDQGVLEVELVESTGCRRLADLQLPAQTERVQRLVRFVSAPCQRPA